MARQKAPSDEGAVSEADWGREHNHFLSLRPFGPPPSSEGGVGAPVGAPHCPLAAAAAAIVSRTAATAAIAEQKDQNDDPPPVVIQAAANTHIIVAHKIYLQAFR